MIFQLAADLVVVFHLGFIAFALAGALLVAWRRWVAWLHLPALGWGVWIALSHGVCPLTPLENALRQRAGSAGYSGGFIEHYLIPLIYPVGLQPAHQVWIAALLIAFNVLLYGWIISRYRLRRPRRD